MTTGGSRKPSQIKASRKLKEPSLSREESAEPIELPLDLIDEDPHQPRSIFDPQLLEDLAETIRQRGVKNPISVHRHPEKTGRFIINDGARRYRASRLAGKKSIKAFVDTDFTKIDQIIVNAHHAGFTPREWAILIDQEEKKGKSRRQIARELGMSAPHITSHAALLHLPDPIAETFNSGRCQDVTALNHLVVVWRQYPDDVEFWLEDPNVEITRLSVAKLRAFLDNRTRKQEPEIPSAAKERKHRKQPRITSPLRFRRPIIEVRFEGRVAQLLFNRRPTRPDMAWVQYQDDRSESEVNLNKVQIISLFEGEKQE
ncbi:MAG: ParB/RepB/Spo0J family partition protein [Nitrosospira sp.]|nr:ParB/RepB/Spo0J family partition protein [Nitrosospira sp.]